MDIQKSLSKCHSTPPYFLPISNPKAVNRYFCNELVGLSGKVISIKPNAKAGDKYLSRKDFLSLKFKAICNCSRLATAFN